MDLTVKARFQFCFENIGGDAQEKHPIALLRGHFGNRQWVLNKRRIGRYVNSSSARFMYSYAAAESKNKSIAACRHARFQPQPAGGGCG